MTRKVLATIAMLAVVLLVAAVAASMLHTAASNLALPLSDAGDHPRTGRRRSTSTRP